MTTITVKCTKGGVTPSFNVSYYNDISNSSEPALFTSAGVAVPGSGGSESCLTNSDVTLPWNTASGTKLDPSTTYIMRLQQANGGGGVDSNHVNVIYNPPSIVSALFDGTNVTVSWTPPCSAPAPSSTKFQLENAVGNSQWPETGDTGTFTFSVNDNMLSDTQYTIKAVGLSEDCTGVWSEAFSVSNLVGTGSKTGPGQPGQPGQPISPQGPVLSGLEVTACSESQLSVTARTPELQGGDGTTEYVAVVLCEGFKVAVSDPVMIGSQPLVHDQRRVPFVLNGSFDPARRYRLALAESTGTGDDQAIGVPGLPMELLLGSPGRVSIETAWVATDLHVFARVTPPAGPWPSTGAVIRLNDADGNPLTDTESGGSGFYQTTVLADAAAGTAYTLCAASARGADIGPPGDPRAILSSVPTATAVSVEGPRLTASWDAVADTGAEGYRLTAAGEGFAPIDGESPGTAGFLLAPAGRSWDELGSVSLALQAVGHETRGPAAVVAPITAAPARAKATWTATGAGCTLSWEALTGVTNLGYAVEISQGRALLHQADTTDARYTVPDGILNAGGDLHFRVRATGGSDVTLTGPWNTPTPIPIGTPGALSVHYDGRTLAVRFAPVPTATGYRMVLVKNGAEQGEPWYRSEPFAITTSPKVADTTLVVQAVLPGGLGPARAQAVFRAGWYPGMATDNNVSIPWLNPAVAADQSAHTITLGLPNLFAQAPANPLPQNGPFTLAAVDSQRHPRYSYSLTLACDGTPNPWTFTGEAIRADLFGTFKDFLTALETAGATPFGVQTVRAAVARAMPQTFAETLLYTHGFSGDDGCVDLTPGLVLRAEQAAYQTLGRATPNQEYLNGFVPSAVAEYAISHINAAPGGFTALDAFIGWLVSQGGTAVTAPPLNDGRQAGAGGLIDSGALAMRQPFLRLLFPQNFPGDEAANSGSPRPGDNTLILAAAKLSLLDSATKTIRGGGDIPDGVGALYFRGRATLTPAIRVTLGGAPMTVSLGTTVAGLLATRAMNPPDLALPLTGLRMERGVQSALLNYPDRYDVGAANPVRLDWVPATHAAYSSLPLLAGDLLDLGRGGSR
ncbi:hypothetical protein [Acanthopleuribacter pedis]|uniref:Fibronectin type-III domain-containing protein n=1 Tax=Acanthopleuribacter pedis TaxID=442870 RepID=A0A8J7QCR9_9BACT|nr:hypothetical protein [Acanthopleuribacter pedis]MBO1321379.1 hypothetical protein [Acanthopleuribacter pedis]